MTSPDAKTYRDELLDVIRKGISAHPRSQQKAIGPSELGTACRRKLGYKLAEVPQANTRVSWKSIVGTAVHAWLAQTFGNAGQRWHTERSVAIITELDGHIVEGTCDLYDADTQRVVDFKILGAKGLGIKRRTDDPGQTYRTQVHLYGAGYDAAGYLVKDVAILALPASGELDEAWLWMEPYNPAVAQWALGRAAHVRQNLAQHGHGVLANYPTVADYCSYCPFFDAHSSDPTIACQGADQGSEW